MSVIWLLPKLQHSIVSSLMQLLNSNCSQIYRTLWLLKSGITCRWCFLSWNSKCCLLTNTKKRKKEKKKTEELKYHEFTCLTRIYHFIQFSFYATNHFWINNVWGFHTSLNSQTWFLIVCMISVPNPFSFCLMK